MDPKDEIQEELVVINKRIEWTEDEWDNFNSEYSIG
jgi:hypothetical protein